MEKEGEDSRRVSCAPVQSSRKAHCPYTLEGRGAGAGVLSILYLARWAGAHHQEMSFNTAKVFRL